jgi:hypothetical protein
MPRVCLKWCKYVEWMQEQHTDTKSLERFGQLARNTIRSIWLYCSCSR